MSILRKPRVGTGLALLNASAWIRRQPWLRSIYRRFPQAFRDTASETLAARANEQVKFKRTANWLHASLAPPPLLAATCSDDFGATAGVNVFAYARGQSGLGESARLYVRALLANGYPVALHNVDINIPHGMDDTSLDGLVGAETPYETNLVFVNPDYLDEAIARIGRERLVGRYTIACWFWELEKFPHRWLPALSMVDEIMVSSRFIGEAIRRVTDKPLLHAPLPVTEIDDRGLQRADFGLDDNAFIFLTSFDFNSFLARKNPLAVIRAFCQAFADGKSNVKLVIKSSNGHRHSEGLRELLNAASVDRRIVVRDELIDRGEMHSLQRCADAYVSLHRAEGFGLGLAECMFMGKPVIATAWSGNMEYMTAENSCLVDYRLVAVGEGEYPHHAGQRWAEPDIRQAAAHMRRLVENPQLAVAIGAQAASDVREKLSPDRAAATIIQRLQTLPLSPSLCTAAVPAFRAPGTT